MRSLSVFQPLDAAIQHTRRILLEPFKLSQWLRLGFCAFLMGSTQQWPLNLWGDQSNDSDSGEGISGVPYAEIQAWIQQHLALIATLVIILILLLIVLGLLFTWLSSRGRFMLLDGVIHNRGAIVMPWRQYRREANSLFRIRVYLGLVAVVVLAVILSVGLFGFAVLREAIFTDGILPGRAMIIMGLSALLLTGWSLFLWVVNVLLMDFVVPVMYQRRMQALPAWNHVVKPLLKERLGSMALYLTVKFALEGVISVVALLAVILTCCIAAVPYVGSVILLPLTIFQLTYPLAFLEQLGADWRFFPPDRQALPPG